MELIDGGKLLGFHPLFTSLTSVDNFSWLYIIEGCISIMIAVWVWFGLPDDPTRASFWSEEEKTMMELREAQRAEYLGNDSFEWKEILRAFQDPKVYMTYVDLVVST